MLLLTFAYTGQHIILNHGAVDIKNLTDHLFTTLNIQSHYATEGEITTLRLQV